MADDRNITLKVQNVPSNGTDNYTNVIASDGTVYSYQFSEVDSNGQTHYGGNVSFTSRGNVTINVNLPHGNGEHYKIDYVDFADDVHQQIAWTADQNTPYKAKIENTNDKLASVYYLVVVKDTDKRYCTIPCDPMINNR